MLTGSNTHFLQANVSLKNIWIENETSDIIYPTSISVLNDDQVSLNFNLNENVILGSYNININNSIDGKLIDLDAVNIISPLFTITGPNKVCQGSKGIIYKIVPNSENLNFDCQVNPSGTNWTLDYNSITHETSVKIDYSEKFTKVSISLSYFKNGSNLTQIFNIDSLQNPVSNFTYSLSCDGTCAAYTINLVNHSKNASSYLWDFGDGTTSSEVNPVHTFQKPGYFNISLTAMNANCMDFMEIVEVNVTSINKVESSSINLYPNPVYDKFYISSTNNELKQIKLFDISGKVITILENLQTNPVSIDVSGLASGIYQVQITSGNLIEYKKIIKR
jgi:PKD repeat protein